MAEGSVLRRAVWRSAASLLAAFVGASLIIYIWYPVLLVHAIALIQRRIAGVHYREVATAFGVVPYLDGGSGTPVVLLHGFQDQKDSWLGVAKQLTPWTRVLIPDLHGFGDNRAATNGDYRPAAQAERVHAFLVALDVSDAHIVGVSMGGEIAGAYAARYPAATLSLALLSPSGTRPDTVSALGRRIMAGRNIFHVTDDATLDTLISAIADSGVTLPRVLKRAMLAEYRRRNPLWDRIFAQLMEPASLFLLDSLAPRMTARALVLWGRHDPLFAVSGGRRLANRMPDASFVELPDCGHLCPLTQPGETAARYLDFLFRGRS